MTESSGPTASWSGRADLHLHTICSDGRYAPREVVGMAARAGVRLLAITDHDTVDALPEARAECELRGLTLIPAVELSVTAERQDLHILGFFVDPGDAGLLAHLRALRNERDLRLEETLSRLRGLGIELAEAAVRREVEAGASVGRTHVAKALVATGHVADIDVAFRRFLRDGGPAHVAKRTPTIEESLGMLLAVAACRCWAHPPAIDSSRCSGDLFALGSWVSR
ncbi:MAG: PHP domain-containing protein [Candidatus Eisenbacteria bacterium]